MSEEQKSCPWHSRHIDGCHACRVANTPTVSVHYTPARSETFAERLVQLEGGREQWPEWMKQWRRDNPIAFPDTPARSEAAGGESPRRSVWGEWIDFADAVGKALGCLYSTLPQGNAHIVKAAERIVAETASLRQQLAAAREALSEAEAHIGSLIDDDPCQFDHHGYCQMHHLGKPCEVASARQWLAARSEPSAEDSQC